MNPLPLLRSARALPPVVHKILTKLARSSASVLLNIAAEIGGFAETVRLGVLMGIATAGEDFWLAEVVLATLAFLLEAVGKKLWWSGALVSDGATL